MSDRLGEEATAFRKYGKKCNNTPYMSIWVSQAFTAVFMVYLDHRPPLPNSKIMTDPKSDGIDSFKMSGTMSDMSVR